jgi:hypothetical protein
MKKDSRREYVVSLKARAASERRLSASVPSMLKNYKGVTVIEALDDTVALVTLPEPTREQILQEQPDIEIEPNIEYKKLGYVDTARVLARGHREADALTTQVYLARDPSFREIRLVEISSAPQGGPEPLPVSFSERQDQRIAYPSSVLLVTPEEWQEIKDGRRQLPDSWGEVGELELLEPEAEQAPTADDSSSV